jgi:hypothetical protein
VVGILKDLLLGPASGGRFLLGRLPALVLHFALVESHGCASMSASRMGLKGAQRASYAFGPARVESAMSEQSPEAILPDLAEAFANAVLAFGNWSRAHEGRLIGLRGKFYPVISICGFVDQYSDQLPEHVFRQLRSYMHDIPDGELIAELHKDNSYSNAARCLRKMIERRETK